MSAEDARPMATYRLQFNRDFRFVDAQSLVPYFSRLGVTHLYASPLLRPRQDSTHGYDVVDPTTINPNLGDKAALISLVRELRNLGLGMILDIVPNHMAASIENPYWRDVLTYGHSSPFAGWFDIDWRMPDPHMWGRVLVPVLGEPRSRVLEKDQLRVAWSHGRFVVEYFEHILPIDPATVPDICEFGIGELEDTLSEQPSVLERIDGILARLRKLPKWGARLRRHVDIDRDETEEWLGQLAQIVIQSPRIEQWAERTASGFGRDSQGRGRLRRLLDSQPYRLVHWRDAARTINYRRFFDINELVSLRQEDPQVFEATHAAILRWVDDGLIDGLRIDHIDGLRDPLGYLERLVDASSSADRGGRPLPIFVEKILARDEKLPCGWPVAGTTGYEFLNQVEAAFVGRDGFAELQTEYRRLLRRPVHFEQIAAAGKRRVLRNDLSPQVGRLADRFLRLQEVSRHPHEAEPALAGAHTRVGESDDSSGPRERFSDPVFDETQARSGVAQSPRLTKRQLVDAIVEVIVALPAYRTYVDSNHCSLSDADRQYIQTALQGARLSGRAAPEAIDALGDVLSLEGASHMSDPELYERVNFVQRFQQLTGPAAAKGIEDTALYAYVPLVSLNEVGGEPHLPQEDAVDVLHHANEERALTWPANMLCVTTHDTKRTADVRARLDVLTELPDLWTSTLTRWRKLNQQHGQRVGSRRIPDAAAEYLLYQTLVGVWPAPRPGQVNLLPSAAERQELHRRVETYMLKAVREAKTFTTWTNQDRAYEEALTAFIRSLLLTESQARDTFCLELQQLVARISRHGFWNSLARTLIQFASPGTPDLYQGDELWNFALVDPDNRRPVDYEVRQRLLDEVITGLERPEESRRGFLRELVAAPEDGRVKLHVVRCALATRRDHPKLFTEGRYVPLSSSGGRAEHLVAFARELNRLDETTAASTAVVVIVPRLTVSLVADHTTAPLGEIAWHDTRIQLPEALQDRSWICALTRESVQSHDGTLSVGEVLRALPVALLVSNAS